MGKKRSKTARQNQARKARKSFGGITMKKATVGKDRNSDTIILKDALKEEKKKNKGGVGGYSNKKNRKIDSNAGAETAMEMDSVADKSSSTSSKADVFQLVQRKKRDAIQSKTNKSNGDDVDDFDRQMQSLRERQAQHEHVVHEAKRKKKMKKKRGGGTQTDSFNLIANETFIIDDRKKSTTRLVEEAVGKISALEGIGATAYAQDSSAQQRGKSNILQVMAAQKRAAWNREAQEEEEDDDDQVDKNNPWSALHENDSDDEDKEPQSTDHVTRPIFNFAPASFAIGDNSIDPDL